MFIVKIIENNTMYSVHELYLCLFLFLHRVTSVIFASLTFSVHSSTSLSTIFFLHLQFSQSKYSPISQDLSHSHSQLFGFQMNPLSHTPLSINSLHLYRHLSLFQRCLLLQTLGSSLYLHLQVSCYSICLVSLVVENRLRTLIFEFLTTSGTHNFA